MGGPRPRGTQRFVVQKKGGKIVCLNQVAVMGLMTALHQTCKQRVQEVAEHGGREAVLAALRILSDHVQCTPMSQIMGRSRAHLLNHIAPFEPPGGSA